MCYIPTTTASFALKFPLIQRSARKDVFPFTQRISKFSFSISEGNQEPSSDQLLGQFPQNVSFSSCKDSRHFVFHHLIVSADQYQRGALLARSV